MPRAGSPRVPHARQNVKRPRRPGEQPFVKKLATVLIPAFLVAMVLLAAAYKVLGWGGGVPEGDPAALAESAREALEAVKARDLKTTMTPAKYDSILLPIDQMLREAAAKLQSPGYDPVRDAEYIRARTEPIPRIADDAHRQALSETSFLKKEYRFMQQKGDACRYLAASLWNFLETMHGRRDPGTPFLPTPQDSEKILGILDQGLDAAPENKFLWYLHALVERAGGAFGTAASNLGKALEIDPDFIAAWNDLGLVQINLKQFDKAEESLERARDLAEKAYTAAKVPPGEDYVTALMNLADFHDALASYYAREARVQPGEEVDRNLRRHEEAAQKYADEVRKFTPYDLPSEKTINIE